MAYNQGKLLNQGAVTDTVQHAEYLLRQIGIVKDVKVVDVLVRSIVSKYIQSTHNHKLPRARIGAKAQLIMMMQVGDSLEFEQQAPQMFRTYFMTARKYQNNPAMRWTQRVIHGTGRTRLTRVDDGADTLIRDPHPRAQFIASLKIGDVKTSDLFKKRSELSTHTKATARRILNKPDADWRGAVTNKGLRVTRLR